MAVKLAIIGVDPRPRAWLDAAISLQESGAAQLVAAGHRSMAAARDTTEAVKALTSRTTVLNAYDDLRVLLQEAAPQAILMDRPANATMDFLLACVEAGVAIFSLGPPVESVAEAHALAAALGPRSRLLYIYPHFVEAAAWRRCASAEEFIRPLRFAAAQWLGFNHALTRGKEPPPGPELPVRSLSVLAWDALSTLVRLMDVPTSVSAAIRGTAGAGNSFADLSGAAAITLRFPDDAAATLSLCDRIPPGAPGDRQLLLWGAAGTLRLESDAYSYHDAEGKLIDRGESLGRPAPAAAQAADALREFLNDLALPATPNGGWEWKLEEIAAVMEAVLVSHRTGQPESPEKFRRLRR